MKFIPKYIDYVNTIKLYENSRYEHKLELYHGSNNSKLYNNFKDNCFFTVNDYIAENYAYNFGGYVYKVKVDMLKPFHIETYNEKYYPDEHKNMVELFRSIYDDEVAEKYENRGLYPSLSSTIYPYGFEQFIKWAKDNGYDSLKFKDQSFDTLIYDTTYIIFDGSKVKVDGIYNFEKNKDVVDYSTNLLNNI